MPPAGNHTSPYHEEEIQLSIQMHQADQFIATAKLITRIGAIDLLAIRWVIMFVEPEQVRSLVAGIVGYEQVGGISQEQPFRIEQLQGAQAAGNLPIEPGVQTLLLSVAGKLAQEVLITRSLAVVIVLLVEAGAGQGHIPGFRMRGFATS